MCQKVGLKSRSHQSKQPSKIEVGNKLEFEVDSTMVCGWFGINRNGDPMNPVSNIGGYAKSPFQVP